METTTETNESKPKKRLSKYHTEAFKMFVSTDPIVRLNQDLDDATKIMGRAEARYLVDLYYQLQEKRKGAGTQVDRCEEAEEPCDILRWVHGNQTRMEGDVKAVLGKFAAQFEVGQWLQAITGIGPVLSAGFLSLFDVRGRKYAGQWWRFAGLDPSMTWLGKAESQKLLNRLDVKKSLTGDQALAISKASGYHTTKILNTWQNGFAINGKRSKGKTGLLKFLSLRPWNNRAKVLCYHAGEMFVKFKNHDNDVYGKHFTIHRAKLERLNQEGAFAQAAERKAKQVGKDTKAYKSYSQGKLPDAHLHARARRWIVKIFLSHFHAVCYREYYGEEPPIPFAFSEHCDGEHTHIVQAPEYKVSGRPLMDLLDE